MFTRLIKIHMRHIDAEEAHTNHSSSIGDWPLYIYIRSTRTVVPDEGYSRAYGNRDIRIPTAQ